MITCGGFQTCITELNRIFSKNKSSLLDNIVKNTCTKQLNAGNLFYKILGRKKRKKGS